jgi:branched-chain amino acid transport system permease protein
MISPYVDTLAIAFVGYLSIAIALQTIISLGQLPLCAGFWFGLGSYAALILETRADLNGLVYALLIVSSIFIINSFLIAPTILLRGRLYTFYTLALQMAFYYITINLWQFTGGHSGIVGLKISISSIISILGGCAILLIIILRSRFYLYCLCVGGDELLAVNLGIPTRSVMYVANLLSGCLVGIGGSIVAIVRNYTDPTSCSLEVSIMSLVAVLLVGTDRFAGPLVAAAILTLIPELLRSITVTAGVSAEVRYLLLGILLVVLVCLRPDIFYPRETYRYDRT